MPNGGTMAGICSSGIRVACLVALHLCYMVWLSIVRRMDVRTHRSREVLVEDVARHHGMKQDGRGLSLETSRILGLGLVTSRILGVGLETRRIGASLVVCGRLIFLSEVADYDPRKLRRDRRDQHRRKDIPDGEVQQHLVHLVPTARAALADGSCSSCRRLVQQHLVRPVHVSRFATFYGCMQVHPIMEDSSKWTAFRC